VEILNDKQKAENLVKAAPPLTSDELDAINANFRAFIFRRSKTRELWTTCCGRHETVPEEDYSDSVYNILAADHHREYEYVPSGWGPGSHSHKRLGDLFQEHCPYCGTLAYVKELGRTGKRDNLAEYGLVVIIRWYRRALWVRAYYVNKKYGNPDTLTAKPGWSLHKVYRFKPGEAISTERNHWFTDEFDYISRITKKPKKLPLRISEPFSSSNWGNTWYSMMGVEEIEKSPFKYCEYKRYINDYGSAMRFLSVCCIFPRQVEMLMKTGMVEVVRDLVNGRRWNAAAFKWEEENPLTSFDLDRNEMKSYLETDKNPDSLACYKQFRRLNIKCEVADLDTILGFHHSKIKTALKLLKEWKIEPARWVSYIKSSVKKKMSDHQIVGYWLDYLDAARKLGYDLENPLVRMPKDLVRKHDEVTQTVNAILAAEQEKKDRREAKRLAAVVAKRCSKYEFRLDGYFVKVPLTAAEVIAEGKALKHCVGGYADRHMKGVLTIIFLRSTAEPDKPLATIEMTGNTMNQIHGYANDGNKTLKPRDEYASFLGPWLAWIKAGSKRDEDGNPILPKGLKAIIEKLAKAG